MEEDERAGWTTTRVLEWVVVGAVSLPLMAGFVALGTAVVAARSLRELARTVWGWVPERETATTVPASTRRHSNAA